MIRGTPRVTDIDRGAPRRPARQRRRRRAVEHRRGAGPRQACASSTSPAASSPTCSIEMDNHIGAVTRVDYAPSTQFYLEDEQRRETRWKTPLPFPVQVVARVEVIDEIRAASSPPNTAITTATGTAPSASSAASAGSTSATPRCSNPRQGSTARSAPPPWRILAAARDAHLVPPGCRSATTATGPSGPARASSGRRPDPARRATEDPLARPDGRGAARRPARAARPRPAHRALCARRHAERGACPLHGHRASIRRSARIADPGRGIRPHAHLLPSSPSPSARPSGNAATSRCAVSPSPTDYDAFGQPRNQIAVAVPRGRDSRAALESGRSLIWSPRPSPPMRRPATTPYMADRVAACDELRDRQRRARAACRNCARRCSPAR